VGRGCLSSGSVSTGLVGRSFRNANQSLLVGGRINLSSKLAIRTNRTLWSHGSSYLVAGLDLAPSRAPIRA
jgi:hypothetical protein